MVRLSDLITSPDESVRNQALDAACATMDLDTLLAQAADLDAFRIDQRVIGYGEIWVTVNLSAF